MTAIGKMQKREMQDQMDKALAVTCQMMITRKILEELIQNLNLFSTQMEKQEQVGDQQQIPRVCMQGYIDI